MKLGNNILLALLVNILLHNLDYFILPSNLLQVQFFYSYYFIILNQYEI